MTAILRSLAGACVLIAAAAPDAAAQQRTTVAFVVGIEHYREKAYDGLQYTADDARMVFEQLRAITNLDEQRSRLLLADDVANTYIDTATLLNELQTFANNIEGNTDVVVYLGGHGLAGTRRALWYLASDYSSKQRNGYLSFGAVMDTFEGAIENEKLHGVTLTLLLNMCEAGNAAGQMSGPSQQLITRAREMIQNKEFGLQRLAVIPATLPDRTTYESEKLGGSIFAKHLREALGGRAAPGSVITTGSVFAYLEKHLGDLPEIAKFDRDIVIGETRTLEAEADYATGTALLAAARSIDVSQRDRDRLRHRLALYDLADHHLSRVRLKSSSLGLRALALQTQSRVARGLTPTVTKVEVAGTSQADSHQDLQQLEGLLDQAAESAGPPSLKALRDELGAGAPFFGLILGSRGSPIREPDGSADVFRNAVTQWITSPRLGTESASKAWRSAFEALSGMKAVEAIDSDTDRVDGSTIDRELEKWVAVAPPRARLVVVHLADAFSPARSDVAGTIVSAIGRWNGPVTLLFLGSYTTLPMETPIRPTQSLSLFFYGGGGSSGVLAGMRGLRQMTLAQLFRDGRAELTAYSSEGADGPGLAEDPRTDNGAWIPNWPQGWLGSRVIQPSLDNFSLQVAAGCVKERPDVCAEAVRKTVAADPFRAIRDAGIAELEGRIGTASAAYREIAAQFRTAAGWVGETVKGVAGVFQSYAGVLEERAGGVESRATRQLVILPVGVAEYESPLVGDLPGTIEDLKKYVDLFSGTSSRTNQPPHVLKRNVLIPKTAEELLAAVRAERAALNPQDLMILVYSGRGVERAGRRYLTTANVTPCPGIPQSGSKCDERAGLVDLWQIADIMRERWLLAIYDAQFTTPVFDSGRRNALLDKHLDSGRPSEPVDNATTGPIVGRLPFRAAARGQLPPQQVHVWVDGPLNAGAASPAGCDGDAHSPLAMMMTGQPINPSPGTYVDWLAKLPQPCLSSSSAVLVAQGDLDVPFLTTGEGAQWVNAFRRDDYRRSMNLRVAASLGAATAEQFDSLHNRLAHAALLLALRWQHSTSTPVTQSEMQGWVLEAQTILSPLKVPAADPDAAALEALRAQMLIDTYLLSDQRAEAVALLQKTEAAVLARRRLAERMVTLTEDEAKRQPISVMNATAKKLVAVQESLKGNLGVAAAQRRLETLVLGEEARLTTDFVIQPPKTRRVE